MVRLLHHLLSEFEDVPKSNPSSPAACAKRVLNERLTDITAMENPGISVAASPITAGTPEAHERAKRENSDPDAALGRVMGKLDTVDFSDPESVLEWLYELQELAREHTALRYDRTSIIRVFNEKGFFANMNAGDGLDQKDPMSVAGLFVGRFLHILNARNRISMNLKSDIEMWRGIWGKRAELAILTADGTSSQEETNTVES